MNHRSDGPHPSTLSQVRPQRDIRSDGPHQQTAGKASQDAKKDFPRLVAMSSNQINHQRENSVDSYQSNDENGYDMVTGANLTLVFGVETCSVSFGDKKKVEGGSIIGSTFNL